MVQLRLTQVGRSPLIIAHRGASGDRPENTLASIHLAADQGADWIELDLVSTADNVLVARHENELSTTTDVGDRPEFADRQTVKVIDGRRLTGWFVEDFTLAELKTLRARERFPMRDSSFNDCFEIPTLDEVMQWVCALKNIRQRPIGLYLELKHPSYFEAIAHPLAPLLLSQLDRYGWNRAESPVIVESFETRILRELRSQSTVPIVQLLDESTTIQPDSGMTYRSLTTPKELEAIAYYANGISVHKSLIVPPDPQSDQLLSPTSLITDAHAQGLWVHAFTFRREPQFLHPAYAGSARAEYQQFLELGIDGVFTDFPQEAIACYQPHLSWA
jgi:glycerophosphoryl diester phosphodiesterase